MQAPPKVLDSGQMHRFLVHHYYLRAMMVREYLVHHRFFRRFASAVRHRHRSKLPPQAAVVLAGVLSCARRATLRTIRRQPAASSAACCGAAAMGVLTFMISTRRPAAAA